MLNLFLRGFQAKFRQIRAEIRSLVFAQHTHGQTNNRPQVNSMVLSFIILGQIVNLGVTVVAWGDSVVSARGDYLVEL